MDRPFHAYAGEEPFAFVSYAHEDADIVYPEITGLHERGVNIWYDEGISPGSTWRDELAQRVEACSVFLYFVSASSVASSHCLKEVNFALDNDKPLLAVHLEELTLPPGLRLSLSDTQAIHRFDMSEAAYREALRESLDSLVGNAPAEERSRSPRPVDAKSLAVLPLVNMSSDPENEYLSDGITEALIDGFSNLEGMQVASRLAAFAYKGQAPDFRTIGERLQVSSILNGSVQKSGNRVRITVQLSRATDGSTLWSHRYDETLEDIFELQDDIARQVIDALKVELAGESTDRLIDVGTRDPAAYDAYLLGHYESEKHTKDGFRRAIQLYEQATQYDDEFADAYGCLARCYVALSSNFGVSREDVIDRARAAYDRARLLGFKGPRRYFDALDIDAWIVGDGGKPTSTTDWKIQQQSRLTDVIERITYPQHPRNEGDRLAGYSGLSSLLMGLVFRRSQLAVHQKIQSERGSDEFMLGWTLTELGRYPEAIANYGIALEQDHNNHFARHMRALDYARTGQIEAAERDLAILSNVWGPRNFGQFCHLVYTQDESAAAYFERLAGSRNFELRLKPVGAAMLGDLDRMVEYLEEGFETGNLGIGAAWMNLYIYAQNADVIEAAERHPGFQTWREKIGLGDDIRREVMRQVNELYPITGIELQFDED